MDEIPAENPPLPELSGGRYELLELIGSGAMGEVYRARDRVLGRAVALKILPSRLVATPERLARFEREARLTAALSHPNLVPVHDFGYQDDKPFIVQELVAGETLEARLDRGPVDPRVAAGWVLQAADGLAAAHEAGVVHRDIKPGNIMLGDDGRIRVLDFGLATFAESSDAETSALTKEGFFVGTTFYVSPEQATGARLDGRSDVFSLGVVLYEMLAGQRPFGGGSPIEVLQSVTRDEPTLPELPGNEALVDVLERALRKDRNLRLGSMSELAAALRGALAGTADPDLPAPPPPVETGAAPGSTVALPEVRHRRRWRIVLGTALALGAAGLLAFVAATRRERPLPPVPHGQPLQLTASIGLDAFPTFAPDGAAITYASDRTGRFQLYRRPLAPGAREVAITDGDDESIQPAASPDGAKIAYHSIRQGGIWLLPALGGAARRLTDFGCRPAWSPDGRFIAFESGPVADLSATALGSLPPSVIWIIPASGGVAVALTEPGSPRGGHGAPTFSSDSRFVTFQCYTPSQSSLWSVPRIGGPPSLLLDGPGHRLDPSYDIRTSALYFIHISERYTTTIQRVPMSARTGMPAGPPEEVVNVGYGTVRQLALSSVGTLAYSALGSPSNLWSQELEPVGGAAVGPPRSLTQETARSSRPAFSPDGELIAYSKFKPGSPKSIWTMRADGTGQTQITAGPADDDFPSFLPGRHLGFLSRRQTPFAIVSRDLGTGREKVLGTVSPGGSFLRLSPDGSRFAFQAPSGPEDAQNTWVGDLSGAPPRPITRDDEMAAFPCWSPDGERLAIEVKRDESTHVAILSSRNAAEEPDILTPEAGQSWPWSFAPDGDRIAYACQRASVWNLCWVSRSSRERRRITSNERLNVTYRYPAWSPTGTQLVYEYAETTGNLFTLDLGRRPE